MEVYTRPGRCVTAQYPELQDVRPAVRAQSVILDGELVCLRDGRPQFADMAYRGRLRQPHKIAVAQGTYLVTFVPFDILAVNGHPCLDEPLVVRKQRMAARGWEGIVAKCDQSRYRREPGRATGSR